MRKKTSQVDFEHREAINSLVHKRYIIFCDESDDKGRFYSNFYGGVLVEASKREMIEAELQECKNLLNIFDGEMK